MAAIAVKQFVFSFSFSFLPTSINCMLELQLLHTEHKQIKHSRKLVLPQFYDPAFVHERVLALNTSRF